jgi:hypothetical protein
MVASSITSVTGRVLMIQLIVTIIYPFLLRSGRIGPVQTFLKRMRFHYWLGYNIAAIVIVHLWIPMSAGLAGRVNFTGLYLATIALILIFVQVTLGRNLSKPKLSARRVVRRWHFWVMVSIVVFVLGHIALNSPTVQILFIR